MCPGTVQAILVMLKELLTDLYEQNSCLRCGMRAPATFSLFRRHLPLQPAMSTALAELTERTRRPLAARAAVP